MDDIYFDNDGGRTYHPLESLNLIDKTSVKPTRETAPSAYTSMFQKHPTHEEHHIYRRKADLQQNQDLSGLREIHTNPIARALNPIPQLNSNSQDDKPKSTLETLVNKHVDHFISHTMKKAKDEAGDAVDSMMTTTVKDDPIMNKYASMSKTAYDHYDGKDPTEALHKSGYTDYKAVDELNTNKDNFVVESEKEVHVSFRGTKNLDDWLDKNTRIASEKIFGKMEDTARYAEAEAQVAKALDYAKAAGKELTFSGHSLGAWFSYHFGKKHNVESHNFNPAISQKQASALEKEGAEALGKEEAAVGGIRTKTQTIYRTPTDAPSANVVTNHKNFHESKTVEVKTINTKPGLDGDLVSAHDVEHFTENPSGVRNTTAGSIVKSLKNTPLWRKVLSRGATALGVGAAAYTEYEDIAADVKMKENTANKAEDIAIDTVKNAGVLYATGMVAGALGGELIIPALLTGLFVDIAAQKTAEVAKTTVKAISNAIQTGKDAEGNDIASNIESSVKSHNESWRENFKAAGRSVSRFFHHH